MSNSVQLHKHIVISTDTGNALGIIRSLFKGGVKPILIYVEEANAIPLLIKSKYLTVVHRAQSIEEAVDILIEIYKTEEEKPFIYTGEDSIESMLDSRYEELKDLFYFFNAGEAGRINRLMDKHEICIVAEKCGCRIPKQEIVDTGDLPKTLHYPVITKTLMSILGAWKGDVYICNNEDELKEAYTKIQSPKLLLNEYIHKKNELAIQGFSIDSGREVYMPYGISFFRFSDDGYGHYMYGRPLEDEKLINQVKSIIKECHYTGCFEVEFLIDQNDQLWFLEVNFRYSFWNYSVTAAGVNFPLTWAQSILDNHITEPQPGSIKPYFTAMSEPRDFKQAVIGRKVSLWKWLKQLHQADVLYFYDPNDPIPAWSFWFNTIIKMITGKN